MGLENKYVSLSDGSDAQIYKTDKSSTAINTAINTIANNQAKFDDLTTMSSSASEVDSLIYGMNYVFASSYVEFNGVDDSLLFQEALNSAVNKTLIVDSPNGNAYKLINIQIPSNSNIILKENVVINSAPITDNNHPILKILDKENINIFGNLNSKIEGLGAENYTGEFNHGVSIKGSKNINISFLDSDDTGGDGFYIGTGAANTYCENINIFECNARRNKRQGMSITNVKGLYITEGNYSNTSGTAPSAGIDIEPNSNADFMEDIIINNVNTENNDGAGINISLALLDGLEKKNVTIDIIGLNAKRNKNGITIGSLDNASGSIMGRINITNAKLIETLEGSFISRNYSSNGIPITINEPYILDSNINEGTTPKYDSVFSIFKESTDSGDYKIGNIKIINPLIKDTRDSTQSVPILYINNLKTTNIDNEAEKIYFLNPVSIGNVNIDTAIDFISSGNVQDENDLLKKEGYSNFTLSPTSYVRTVSNRLEDGSLQVVSLGDFPIESPLITFIVEKDGSYLRIDPSINTQIKPFGNGLGKYMQSNTIGSKVTIRKKTDTIWIIEDIVGTWEYEA